MKAPDVTYIHTDIPVGMTIKEYRAKRKKPSKKVNPIVSLFKRGLL